VWSAAVTLTKDAAVQFIDIDPASREYGRRFPVDTSFTSESTLYGVIILGTLKDTDGKPLGRSRAFHEAFEQTKDADEKTKAALEPLHAFQSLWDSTDPSAKARHVAREPYDDQLPKPYFLPQGLIDGYFHPGAQTAIGGALGTTLIGEELDPTLPRTLRLDGRGTTTAYPLRNNLNGVTAGTVQMQTPFELGHYIVFDVPSTGAQVGCFLARVGTAQGPAIVSPRLLDDGCD
jgi:hypothetical protein